jgi:adenylate cyclase
MSPAQRKRTRPLCTVLFVDVCDSTGLYATLGNARAQAAIVKTLEILSRIAIHQRGTVVKTAGDGGLCTFPTVVDAAEAAMEMQRSVQRTTTLADIGVESLAMRAGFHSGPVISREGDVFGDAVNVAARMVALAKPGQIVVAKQTAKRLAKSTSVRFVGSIEVKGKSEPFDLFEVVWDHANLTEMRVVSTAKRSYAKLTVAFGTSTIEVDHRRPVIRMGRGPDNEIVVPHAVASRVHARIEYRRGRFILVDQSLNGTYLDIHGGTAIALRRDEIALEGSGLISLGKSGADQHELCVRYAIRSGEES